MKTTKVDKSPSLPDETLSETVAHAVKGDDEPMEESHPNASFGLVALSYPLMLIGALLIAYVVYCYL